MYLNPTPRHTLTYTTYTYTHLLHLRPHLPSTPKPTLTSSTFSQSFTNWPLLLGFLLGAIAMQCNALSYGDILTTQPGIDSSVAFFILDLLGYYPVENLFFLHSWHYELLSVTETSSLLVLQAITYTNHCQMLRLLPSRCYEPLPDAYSSSFLVI